MKMKRLHHFVRLRMMALATVAVGLGCGVSACRAGVDAMALQWLRQTAPGIEKTLLSDGCRLTVGRDRSSSTTVVLAEFAARPQVLYRVGATIGAVGLPSDASAALTVCWLNEEGKDVAAEEKALGFQDPTLRTSVSVGWNGRTVVLSAVGPAARTAIRRGRIELVLTSLRAGEVITVKMLAVREGNADGAVAAVETDDRLMASAQSGEFGHNLVPNASFEEGEGASVTGWRYEGNGTPHLGRGGYAGKRCLLLKGDNTDGRWVSDVAAITPKVPVWLCYWTRFSEYARPAGHPHPVQFEFLRRGSDGRMTTVPAPIRWQFSGGKYFSLYGQWFPVVVGPLLPPTDATHIRAVTRYQDSFRNWTAVPAIANWGEIAVDNVALWQSKAASSPAADWRISPYGEMLASAENGLPPFVPVGTRRDNSVAVFPVRSEDANLFFADDVRTPAVRVRLGNLLSVRRRLTLAGKVLDWNGKTVSTFTLPAALTPYGVVEQTLPVGKIATYGVYLAELQVVEGQASCGGSTVRFAWLRRPHLADAVRHDDRYPFDLHPWRINADLEGMSDPAEIDFQMRLLRLMGVRGIRLQSRFHRMDFADPQRAAAGARSKVEIWRRNVLPFMRKYGIEGWVSMMEQGSNNVRAPRSEADFRAWYAYNYEQVKAFGDDIKFFLFGNEGLGRHTPEDPDASCLLKSSFAGTTRDWMKAYQSVYRAAKDARPKCLIGPSQASDTNALVIRRFYRILGTDAKFDCWGFNAYGNSAEMGANIFKVLQEHHAAGVFGVIPEVGIDVPTFGNARVAGERRQAIGLVQTYLSVLAQAPWIKRIAWFMLYSGRGVEGHQLFDADWTPRPAAAAYLVMTDHLGAGRVEKKIDLPGGGEFFVWRKTDGSVTGVGWAAGERVITLDTGTAQVAVDDLFGNRQTLKSVDGLVNVVLSEAPVYVVGARQLERSRRFEISARNVTAVTDGSAEVAVEVRNNGTTADSLTLKVQAHPLIRVSPASVVLTVPAGLTEVRKFKVSFLRKNDRLRSALSFQATTSSGMTFRVRLSDTFACCVRAPRGFRLDGDWRQWKRAAVLHADQRTQAEQPMGVAWKGPEDVSAAIRTMWDDRYFYLGLQVRDDVFFARQPADRMFLHDAVEIGFDFEHRLSGSSRLWQLVMGRSVQGNALFRHQPGAGGAVVNPAMKIMVQPTGKNGDVNYQVAIPWSELGGFVPAAGRQIGFGVIVDDSDGKPGDRRFISWFGSGISSKRPQELGDLIFVN